MAGNIIYDHEDENSFEKVFRRFLVHLQNPSTFTEHVCIAGDCHGLLAAKIRNSSRFPM